MNNEGIIHEELKINNGESTIVTQNENQPGNNINNYLVALPMIAKIGSLKVCSSFFVLFFCFYQFKQAVMSSFQLMLNYSLRL